MSLREKHTPQRRLCLHCTISFHAESESEKFCCAACELVYETINSLGMKDFYAYREKSLPSRLEKPSPLKTSFSFMDDEEFVARHTVGLNGLRSVQFFLEGVHCSACVWLIERLSKVKRGIVEARLHLTKKTATILFDPGQISLSHIAATLNSLGYSPAFPRVSSVEDMMRRAEHAALSRLGVAAFCFGNIMILSVSLYEGEYSGMEGPYASFFSILCAVLSLPALLYSARPFFSGFLGKLRSGFIHLDMVIAVSLAGAFVLSVFHLIQGSGPLYFDSLISLIFFLQLGRFIQLRAVNHAEQQTRRAFTLLPLAATVVNDDGPHEIPVYALTPGVRIRVVAGERIPVDGTVRGGQSSVDESILTGESYPVVKSVGSSVFAGSLNVDGVLEVHAEAVGETTRLEQIINAIRNQKEPLLWPLERRSTTILFGMLLIGSSVAAYLVPQDFAELSSRLLALLVVICPCAIGLARPTATALALGRAAKQGILIRSADALYTIPKSKTVLFDKTGTVTSGKLVVAAVVNCVPSHDDSAVRRVVHCAARATPQHPVAQALAAWSANMEVPSSWLTRAFPGRGVSVVVDDVEWSVGSARWLREKGIDADELDDSDFAEAGVFVAEGKKMCTAIFFNDEVRSGMKEVIQGLSTHREVWLVSGDRREKVLAVAQLCGIPEDQVVAEVYPEQKETLVHECDGPTVMFGDGINDKRALHAADVGVAVQGGIESVLEGIDVYIQEPTGEMIAELFDGAGRAMRLITFNFALSLCYNVVTASCAVGGYISPLVAAVLMPISSLTVVLVSVYTPTFRVNRR